MINFTYWIHWLEKDAIGEVYELHLNDSCSWEEILKQIDFLRENDNVLSCWVINGDTKKYVIHECYMDINGNRHVKSKEYDEKKVNR